MNFWMNCNKNKNMEKLLIVDGSNLLFQMFFGMPARLVNDDGKAMQGTLGFVGAILKIIRRVEPTHLFVIFDGEHENVRSKTDAEYKANRIDYSEVGEDDNPYSQLPDVYKALNYLGIKYIETTTCEADDVIAGYALEYGADYEVIISSFDSDFFQLITEKVSVLRYRGKKTIICTPAYIKEKFDISPVQYADFKALVGDNSDNIKGVNKVGSKTAAILLKEYGTLYGLLDNVDKISRPAIKDSILANIERVKRNYKLIKLLPMNELPFNLRDLEFEDQGMKTNDVLKGIGLK